MNKILSIDFEFKNSNEKFLTLVSVSYKDETNGDSFTYWLLGDKDKQKKVKEHLQTFIDSGYMILTFYASAEVRSFLSLGFTKDEILKIKWIDLYVVWSMLVQNVRDCKYGKMYHRNEEGKYSLIYTREPDKKKNEIPYGEFYFDSKQNMEIPCGELKFKKFGFGLSDCIMCLLDVNLDSTHKDLMRNKILFSKIYSNKDIEDILSYNNSDINYLLSALRKGLYLLKIYSGDRFRLKHLLEMSLFSAATGIMENYGLPVDVEKLKNFSFNYKYLVDTAVEECNSIKVFYREYIKTDKKTGVMIRKWKRDDKKIQDYISTLGLDDRWKKTAKGSYSTTDKVLRSFTYLRPIQSLKHTKEVLNILNRFEDTTLINDMNSGLKTTKFKKYMSNIGSDDRIRFLSSPFKSATSRSQPQSSKGNILGWSSWLRVLINPTDSNYVIIGADFSSQEIAISAVLSQDQNYIDSYNSSDPYFWLAQKSGFIDPSYIKKSGKFYDKDYNLLSEDIQLTCKNTRNMFKALTLGINYGMQEVSLSQHLNTALLEMLYGEDKVLYNNYLKGIEPEKWVSRFEEIKYVSGLKTDNTSHYPQKRRANFLIELHKRSYPNYWLFRNDKINKFKKNKYEVLPDGWFSFNSVSKNENSIANFPIQGTAATILRRSMLNALKYDLEVVATLHDAIYIVSHVNDIEKNKQLLIKSMSEGATDVLGINIIRIDVDVYSVDWVNKKSKWIKEIEMDTFRNYHRYFVEKIKNNLFE